MKKILVADNAEMNKSIIHEIFDTQYEIIQTNSSEVAFNLSIQYKDDISIILINETIAQNFQKNTIQTMTDLKIFENIPVILILNNDYIKVRSLQVELPYSDVVNSPINPYIIRKRVANLVELFSHKNELEKLIEKQTEKIISQNNALKIQQKKINTINNDMLDTLSTVIEYRDVESGRHIHRIRKFTEVLLKVLAKRYPKYNLTEEKIDLITSASSLHDIGKIAIPDSILLSPRRLTYEEFKIMKTHTVKGCEILDQLDSVEKNEYYTYCYDICRYHHEKYDGLGYPDGLVGDEIPIWAQVVSVADCYDALTSERPYKSAFSHEKAVEMIRTGACGAFSNEMMDCFSRVLPEFKKLAAEYADVNHADRSISQESHSVKNNEDPKEDHSKDIYNKMDRDELIRTIEKQKARMIETHKQDCEIYYKISDFVFEFDIKHDTIHERKGGFANIFGYIPKNYNETIMLFAELCPEEYRNKFIRTFRMENIYSEVKNGNERVILECPMRVKRNHYIPVRSTVVPVVKNGNIITIYGSGLVLKNYIHESDTEHDRDTVTGLLNYAGLHKEIDDFIEHSGKNSSHMLLLIDIDGFRSINRQTGYKFGDDILRDIAQVLRRQFTDSNIIGRVEDDNFLVFVNDCNDKDENFSIIDNIFRCLHKTYTFDGKTFPEVTASIGVASYPSDGSDFETLFTNASKAVDIAKINGKNMYLFYNENMRNSWEIKKYDSSIRGNENINFNVSDFDTYFVPVVDSASNNILSYDIIEAVSTDESTFDFESVYNALYHSSNVSAASLNSVKRVISYIYKLEQNGIPLPRINITTMFIGYDCETIIKALEEILDTYPINCRRICINITQDMLKTMDANSLKRFVRFLSDCGFEICVYNVGLESINTKCFTDRLFGRVIFAQSFLNDISDGVVSVNVLINLMECFAGIGAKTYFPVSISSDLIRQIKYKTQLSFGIHRKEYMSVEDFEAQMKNESYIPQYPALSHEENSLVLSEKIYDEILEQTRSFIMEWTPRFDSVKFSGSFEKLYGYCPNGMDFVRKLKNDKFIHPDDIRKFLKKLSFSRSETSDTECLVRIYSEKANDYIWNRIRFVSVKNAAGVPVKIIAVYVDVSEDRESGSEDTIRRDRTDYITGVYNARATENKIRNYLYDEGTGGSHAMIVAEICGFDELENVLGKVFANAVLKETAQNIREIFRDSDIIGRSSGNRFTIFVKGLNMPSKLIEKAELICSIINHSYESESGNVVIFGKTGISLYPSDGHSYDELYYAALNALYFARHSVSKSFAFSSDSSLKTKRLEG